MCFLKCVKREIKPILSVLKGLLRWKVDNFFKIRKSIWELHFFGLENFLIIIPKNFVYVWNLRNDSEKIASHTFEIASSGKLICKTFFTSKVFLRQLRVNSSHKEHLELISYNISPRLTFFLIIWYETFNLPMVSWKHDSTVCPKVGQDRGPRKQTSLLDKLKTILVEEHGPCMYPEIAFNSWNYK